MHRPRGLNDPGGWGCAEVGEQGRTLGYSNPTRSMGVSLSGPHPRSLRHFPPASVSPGVRRYGNTAQLSLGCRALPVELPRPRISPAGRYRSFPTKLDTRGLQPAVLQRRKG